MTIISFHICQFLLVILTCIAGYEAGKISYEFENVIGGAGLPRSPWRSKASENGTLDIYRGDKIQLKLCATDDIVLNIDNIVYSNDGDADRVRILVGKTVIGAFDSAPIYNGWGKYWNEFKMSGKIGEPITLPRGEHFMYLDVVSSDCYGVELDKVDMSTNIVVTVDSLVCGTKLILAAVPTTCSAPLDAPLDTAHAPTKPTTAAVIETTSKPTTTGVVTTISASTKKTTEEMPTFVEQLSFDSGCLDIPNVKVKFNPTSLVNVSIYARSTENDKFDHFGVNKAGSKPSKGPCNRSVWQIGVADQDNSELGPQSVSTTVDHDVATHTDATFPSAVDPSVTQDVRVTYVVPPDINIKRGVVYLTLGLVNVTAKTKVGVQYYGRAKTNPSEVNYKSFSPDQHVVMWKLPARSVSPLLENQLHIYFNEAGGKRINIDFLRLDYTTSDITFKSKPLLQTPFYRVQGIQYKVRKTLKTPEGINLTINGKEEAGNYAKVVLLTKQNRRGKFWKVLTVTAEGEIIPFHANKKSTKTNKATEGVTFGGISGIIFGPQSKKISNVKIDTQGTIITVTFADGEYVKFTVNYSNKRTKLIITDSTLTDMSIMYQSTHINDYMTAVNKVVIDNKAEIHIMKYLNTKGERFTFIKTSPNLIYQNTKLELHFPTIVIPGN